MAVSLGLPDAGAGTLLARRVAWVIAARLVVLLVALGAITLLNLRQGFDVGAASVQIGLATLAFGFALSIAYGAWLRSGRALRTLAVTQLVLDQVIWSVLVYLTGGASSGATSFYGLTCLLGAFLTGFRDAAIAGIAGAGCYIALALGLQWGVVGPPLGQSPDVYRVTGEELSYYIVVNLLVVVVVTLLASNLAERLRTAGGRIVAAEQRADRAERMAALGRLAAGLAHEIRNPLGSISGSVRLLRSATGLTDEDRMLCDIIQREASRLNELVSDMMNVAKPRPPDIRVVDAAAIAREVVRLASRSGRASSDVSVEYRGESMVAVLADAAQLRQLIWNLVRNAVQASSPGDSVEVLLTARADDHVELVVADRGVGLDAQAKEQLFDAFFTTRSHGTGIGLAVVKRIADDHGFSIDVESEEGRGARFRLDLGERQDSAPDAEATARVPWSIPPV